MLAGAPVLAEVVITVAKDGGAQFATVQAALDAIPAGGTVRHVVQIAPGRYEERVTIPKNKPFVTLRGADPNTTIITYKLGANAPDETGQPIGTSKTGTVYILAHDCAAEGLAFENSFGEGAQAVAMFARADRLVFRNCRFLGWQDTLYADGGRQYYKDCLIEGHCDFIFGNAAAFFQDCTVRCLSANYITAHSRTAANQTTGYVFQDCKIVTVDPGQGVYLGRPWRPYARVVYLNCWMDAGVRGEGWHNWRDPSREATVFYAEYRSQGPGANPSARVSWSRQLTDEQAKAFSAENFLKGTDGWSPQGPPATRPASQPEATE
jgi:pectinesterase